MEIALCEFPKQLLSKSVKFNCPRVAVGIHGCESMRPDAQIQWNLVFIKGRTDEIAIEEPHQRTFCN